MKSKGTLIIGATFGFLSVALGAFGAHALKPMLIEAGRLDTFELAVRYQFFHALALLFTGLYLKHNSVAQLHYASLCFSIGTILFSGSLYLLCFSSSSGIGLVTPIGGVFFLLGWLFLLLSVLKEKQ